MTKVDSPLAESGLARLGLRLSDWFERWFPDAFALALTAVAIVFVATLATKTIATAVSASAKASGNQRSNQSDSRNPSVASVDRAVISCVCGILRRPLRPRDTYKVLV
jgi:hypothetical protein